MTGFHRMVPRSRRHRCVRCGRRYNGMGGICPGCTTVGADAVAKIERERMRKVREMRKKLDPGCQALREANIDPPTAERRKA